MFESPDLPALVVVVNNPADWARVVAGGWYRIPLRHAPPAVAASFLAFYHTSRSGGPPFVIDDYAPVRRYRQALRRELLPDAPDHPRAAELYYAVELGPLRQLPQPIPSGRLRRITFIPTTLGQLLTARTVRELWPRDAAGDVARRSFPHAMLKAAHRLTVEPDGAD